MNVDEACADGFERAFGGAAARLGVGREVGAYAEAEDRRLETQSRLVSTVCCQSPLALPTASSRPSGAMMSRLVVGRSLPTGSITTSIARHRSDQRVNQLRGIASAITSSPRSLGCKLSPTWQAEPPVEL